MLVGLAALPLPAIAEASVAGPGFVNLRLTPEWLAEKLADELVGNEDGRRGLCGGLNRGHIGHICDALTRSGLDLDGSEAASGEGLSVLRHQSGVRRTGGRGGVGNMRFKSSTNRAPRRTVPGTPGDVRTLRLELQVLADVGLLGLPNAGKSTFLRAVSQARPKVSDYPFTTLHPELGVVDVGTDSSFVIADIPGLVKGAATGVGLGVRFLNHLKRTRLLLHIVDIGPNASNDPVTDIKTVERELAEFDSGLADRPRWLILNKVDLIADEESEHILQALVESLGWTSPSFAVSGITGKGCRGVMLAIQRWLSQQGRLTKQ